MASRVRWGILGTATIARAFADAIGRSGTAELVAVGSRTSASASAFASHYGCAAEALYEALVGRDDVDIVYVATPQSRHVDDALLALGAGKHVLVEKPLALTGTDARRIAVRAADQRLLALEGMWSLFNPLIQRLVSIARSGELGHLRMFSANAGPIGVPFGHRALTAELGASVLWECLVYSAALLTALEPSFVSADVVDAWSVVSESGVDIATTVTLASGGGFAQFEGAFAPGSGGAAVSRGRVLFDRGWVEWSDLYNPAELTIGWNDGRVDTWASDAVERGFEYEIDAVSSAVGGSNLPVYTDLDSSIARVDLLERIARARRVAGVMAAP